MGPSALNDRPKLRDDIVMVPQVERGEELYVYKVQETQDYYRIDAIQHAILGLMDGTRTPAEVARDFNSASAGLTIDEDFVRSYVDSMRATGIFEASREEKRRLFLEKMRDDRRRLAENRNRFGNVFQFTLSAWNPDRFFESVLSYTRFFYSPGFLIVSAASMLIMLGLWADRWDVIRRGTFELFSFEGKTGNDLLQFFVALLIIGFFHECAHGLTCKYFGGQVNRMGFMFVYFTPCFFVDVSDAYLFDRHYKKQWTIYAGGYFEVFLCSIATFIWVLTDPGTLTHDFFYKFLLLSGLTSVIVNYNPLIKLDGYYSLMDYVQIPDLWERSFAWVADWVKKTIFRLPVEVEVVGRSVRRIFVTYCLLSMLYKVTLLTALLIFLKNVLLGLFGKAGYTLLVLAILGLFRKPIARLGSFLRFTLLDKKEVLMTRRSMLLTGGVCGSLIVLAVAIPVPVGIRSPVVIEPRDRAHARAPSAGLVDRVLVDEGRAVAADQPLAVLRDDRLTTRLATIEKRLDRLDRDIAMAEDRQDRAQAVARSREREALRQELGAGREKAAALVVRAPIAGVVATARLADRAGTFLTAGEEFCEIAAADLVARVPVREARIDEVRTGHAVTLNLAAHPFRTFRGEVIAIAPASAGLELDTPREFTDIEALIQVSDPLHALKPGMTGQARIRVGTSTVAIRVARAIRRWIGSRLW